MQSPRCRSNFLRSTGDNSSKRYSASNLPVLTLEQLASVFTEKNTSSAGSRFLPILYLVLSSPARTGVLPARALRFQKILSPRVSRPGGHRRVITAANLYGAAAARFRAAGAFGPPLQVRFVPAPLTAGAVLDSC